MTPALAILGGALGGLLTAAHARRLGRREPRFWAIVLVVMQVIYLLFALFAPDAAGMLREALALAVFTAIAVVGSRRSSWFLVLGLLAHGAWDLRHLLVRQDYVVSIYPELCVGYDWLLVCYLLLFAGSMDRDRRPVPERVAAGS